MTAPPLRVEIGSIRIAAASGLDARRLADALPAAIERALVRLSAGGPPPPPGRALSPADDAAAQIADAVAAGLRGAR
jgi:hypothetical protein